METMHDRLLEKVMATTGCSPTAAARTLGAVLDELRVPDDGAYTAAREALEEFRASDGGGDAREVAFGKLAKAMIPPE